MEDVSQLGLRSASHWLTQDTYVRPAVFLRPVLRADPTHMTRRQTPVTVETPSIGCRELWPLQLGGKLMDQAASRPRTRPGVDGRELDGE